MCVCACVCTLPNVLNSEEKKSEKMSQSKRIFSHTFREVLVAVSLHQQPALFVLRCCDCSPFMSLVTAAAAAALPGCRAEEPARCLQVADGEELRAEGRASQGKDAPEEGGGHEDGGRRQLEAASKLRGIFPGGKCKLRLYTRRCASAENVCDCVKEG